MTSKTRGADTGISVDAIDTRGSVHARVAETFVDVILAVDTGSASGTNTLVAVDAILADTTILAGFHDTFVDLSLAKKTGVAG